MTTPYTYLLKHLPTGKVYYGCRFAKNCDPSEFWVKYKTSSKYVKELIDQYGEDTFVFEIRKTFNDVKSCRLWETRVLKRMDAVNRDIFLNKTDNISISPDAALRGSTSNKRSLDLIRRQAYNMGKKNKGRKASTETRKKMPESHKGISTWNAGIKSSEQTCQKQATARKGKKIYTNKLGQSKLFYPGAEPEGFVIKTKVRRK